MQTIQQANMDPLFEDLLRLLSEEEIIRIGYRAEKKGNRALVQILITKIAELEARNAD
jgi:hypothetical protein